MSLGFKTSSLALALSTVLLSACSDDTDHDFEASRQASLEAASQQEASFFSPDYDPTQGKIPFPSHLVYNRETQRVALPVTADTAASDPRLAVNQLDGFSVSSPISMAFTQEIDSGSLVLGDTVRVIELNAQGNAPVGELGAADVSITSQGNTLYIVPIKPLKSATQYLVGLTDGIVSAKGDAAQDSLMYSLLSGDTNTSSLTQDPASQAQLQAIQAGNNGFEALLAASGVTNDVVTSWMFRTQNTQATLEALATEAASSASITAHTLTLNYLAPLSALNPQSTQGTASVFAGSLKVPYYLNVPSSTNPAAVRSGFFTTGEQAAASGVVPDTTATLEVPVLAVIPQGPSAPVTIYQHGITANRTSLLGLADSYLNAGRAVIAIDMPLHGIDDSNPLYSTLATAQGTAQERTFLVDLVNNDTQAPGPDGKVDASGEHFVNLTSLLTSRDNLRQAVSDLLVLRNSLATVTLNNAPTGESLDNTRVSFVGHSLGGIIGTTYTALDTQVTRASLGMAGGQIAEIFRQSTTFGPTLEQGLQSVGIAPGSAEFAQFALLSQTVFDAVDPINYAERFVSGNNVAQLFEISGDGVNTQPDQVVPNGGVAPTPMMGSQGLSRLLGLTPIAKTAGSQTLSGSGVITRFTQGDHSSLVNPAGNLDVYLEIQGQLGSFAASNGASVTVTDATHIKAP